MAEPFDTLAQRLKDALTTGDVAEVAGVLADLEPDVLTQLRESMVLLGRYDGFLFTEGPPPNSIGAPDAMAIDRINRVLYGPKDALTGWPAGTPFAEGPQGPAGTITSFTVATGAPGSSASIVQGGTPSARTYALTVPRGDVGPTPNISIGTVTSGAAGSSASATMTGTAASPVLNLIIPRGNTGADATITDVTVSTGAAGSSASVVVGGSPGARTLAFTLPRGDVGATPNLTIGTVSEGAAAATITGTATNPVLNLTIPKGNTGATPALSIGTVTTGTAGSDAVVTITGTAAAPVLNFTLPRGAAGAGSGDMQAANNLSDLTDKAAARTNLSVYSKAETDAALGGKQASLGFTPEDASKKGQANGYAGLGSDGKVPSAQLPAAPTVPVKTTGAALRAATNDTDFVTPKSVADAAALVALTDAATIAVDLAAGTNFTVTLAGNRTLGAPTNAKPGMSGTILIKQDATGSRTLAYNTAWKPFGSTPALSTAASAVDMLTWIVEDAGKIRFILAKGGAA
ncbi:hypothetical protein [uncultured Brevundimonas sp.]|uniref:hypothetical protein n=1 Tax=uncultured Brevundimonas sp. TaxID=213418 RepID=UPI0025E5095C|nr:hypothetical protein [uncultured Brevundimonas sp.]